MTADRWALLRTILDEAFERPLAERAAFLDRRCADDPGLRSEIESLLAADARADADAILRAPVDAVAAAALADAPPEGAFSGWAGRTVGAYRITRLLGEGGMGIVFEAQQANPQRLVALKVVRTGPFVDDGRLRLFQREAEALARLQHPGIAAIFEAGRTPEGQHYFVMELARGVPLHERLRGRPSPADAAERRFRLELFLEIADAIAYAHRRGVIHRDLKPSNVVVDADGRVKVLDFGLARITDGDVALSTVVTDRAVIQGTLPYMSPEQAGGDPSAIDLRSDVYSLGVLLFEMLTGELPLPIRDAALPEAVRAILDDAPRRPSAIVPALRGDLETIAGKALAKDPGDRYGSVDALAEDVRRHLDDQPILARPPSGVEQIRRFGRRHRVAASFALAALVALVAGIAGTTTAMLRARAAERSAREEASTADAVSGFLVDLFLVSDPGEARGNSITARELLDRGVAEVDSALAEEPQVRGRLLGTMGQVYRNLGLYGEALPLLERSLEVRESNPREDPLQIARSHYSLAGLLRRLSRYDEARGHYESALRIRERSRAPEEEIAASLMGLANLHYDLAEFEEAVPLYERARELARTSLGEDHFDYPSFVAGLAFVKYQLGQGEEACTLFEEVARRREKALGPDHPTLAYDLRTWAMILNDLGRIDEARPVAERALALAERTLGPEHAFVGEALNTLGRTQAAAGDPDTAVDTHRRALAITQRVYGDAHPLTAETKDLLAADLLALGRPAEALAICAEADSVAAAMPADHPSRRDHEHLRARLVAAVAERPGT